MARFAKLTISAHIGVPQQAAIEVEILGRPVRFVAASYDGNTGDSDWYFKQVYSGAYGYGIVPENAASLAGAIQRYLNFIGEARYQVTHAYTSDWMGYPQSLQVYVTASLYDNALSFGQVRVTGDPNGLVHLMVASNADPIVVSHQVRQATCYGSGTGSIALSVVGGVPPYTIRWEDGTAEANRYNLPRGLYKVTVTDSAVPQPTIPDLPPDSPYQIFTEDHGSVAELDIFVGENPQILVEGIIGNNSIAVSVSGGTLPYTYSWSDGVTSKDRTDVEPGSYRLTVRDALGCTQTVTFSIALERFFFSKNPVLLELQATGLEEKPNLRFVCEVWVEPAYLSGEFVLATPEPFEHPANKEGRTRFDVSEILDAFVAPHLPDFGQSAVKRADKAFKRFYLRYTEVYGNDVMDPFTVQDHRYVLYGGLDTAEHYAGTFFQSFLPNRKPFFTWEPPVKQVLADQPEYLYFMPNSFELTDFRVKVKVIFTDGTTASFQPFLQAGIRRFELYCIPVGHDQLGLGALQPGKEVASWDVHLVDGFANVLSETRRFVLERRAYAQVRYFLYANALGGYNTLAATGVAKLQVDAQAQVLERNRALDADSGDAMVISKYSKRTLQLSTGYKSRAELVALQDFLNSEDVRLVGSDRYIPGRLGDRSATVRDESKTINAFSFDFILSRMHSYTPALRLEGYQDESASLSPLAP